MVDLLKRDNRPPHGRLGRVRVRRMGCGHEWDEPPFQRRQMVERLEWDNRVPQWRLGYLCV
ncbi:MAG: hypothetical protein NVSMB53_07830 [Gemmatimonadaceae bacterium]